jgi:hypothetical protein
MRNMTAQILHLHADTYQCYWTKELWSRLAAVVHTSKKRHDLETHNADEHLLAPPLTRIKAYLPSTWARDIGNQRQRARE